jgi:hypothetical protein
MERRPAADQVRLVEVLRAGVNGIIICAVREARRLLDEGLHVKGDLPTGGTPNWNWPKGVERWLHVGRVNGPGDGIGDPRDYPSIEHQEHVAHVMSAFTSRHNS